MNKPINELRIDGKIVSDFELRHTKNKQTPVVNFRLMHVNRFRKNPVYIDIEAWGEEAENVADVCYRGAEVIVHGELRRDVWKNTNGDNRSKIKITALKVLPDFAGDAQSVSKDWEN